MKIVGNEKFVICYMIEVESLRDAARSYTIDTVIRNRKFYVISYNLFCNIFRNLSIG